MPTFQEVGIFFRPADGGPPGWWRGTSNVDFANALVSVHMDRNGVPDIITLNKHFNRLPGVNRMSPRGYLAEN